MSEHEESNTFVKGHYVLTCPENWHVYKRHTLNHAGAMGIADILRGGMTSTNFSEKAKELGIKGISK